MVSHHHTQNVLLSKTQVKLPTPLHSQLFPALSLNQSRDGGVGGAINFTPVTPESQKAKGGLALALPETVWWGGGLMAEGRKICCKACSLLHLLCTLLSMASTERLISSCHADSCGSQAVPRV
jgi:hypothetical protein